MKSDKGKIVSLAWRYSLRWGFLRDTNAFLSRLTVLLDLNPINRPASSLLGQAARLDGEWQDLNGLQKHNGTAGPRWLKV